MSSPSGSLPVVLLTGFLGAGKTTFLNRLLADPALGETGVIVNEFGEVPVDGTLIEAASGGAVLEMAGGCLCCAGGGALDQTLADLIGTAEKRGKPLSRIVIETSGMADPLPILAEIGASRHVVLTGVLTVVDHLHGETTLEQFDEARRQVAVADRIVLSKADLADDKRQSGLHSALGRLAPQSAIGDVNDDPAVLLADGLSIGNDKRSYGHSSAPSSDSAGAILHGHGAPGHSHSHSAAYATTVLRARQPMVPMALNGFLEVLVGTLGSRLLRAKGLVRIEGEPRPLVIQAVQGMVHPPSFLDRWPDDAPQETALVLITQGDCADEVNALFGAFTGQVAPDRPDAAALSDNPLAVPGFSSF